jgi:hypothetical protein
MTDAPISGPLFDAYAFALKVKAAVERAGGMRAAARVSGIPLATFSRAVNRTVPISHENYLRLEAWMEHQERAAA